jgi:hypothetical protein
MVGISIFFLNKKPAISFPKLVLSFSIIFSLLIFQSKNTHSGLILLVAVMSEIEYTENYSSKVKLEIIPFLSFYLYWQEMSILNLCLNLRPFLLKVLEFDFSKNL